MSQLCFVARNDTFKRAGLMWSHHCFISGTGSGWIQVDIELHFPCLRLNFFFNLCIRSPLASNHTNRYCLALSVFLYIYRGKK